MATSKNRLVAEYMAVDPEGSVVQLGYGLKLQEKLGRLGIFRLLDLSFTARYQDRSKSYSWANCA